MANINWELAATNIKGIAMKAFREFVTETKYSSDEVNPLHKDLDDLHKHTKTSAYEESNKVYHEKKFHNSSQLHQVRALMKKHGYKESTTHKLNNGDHVTRYYKDHKSSSGYGASYQKGLHASESEVTHDGDNGVVHVKTYRSA